jgi:hypothetical protein
VSSRTLLQPMFGLTLVVLWLAGCSRAPVGPTITPTPIPATVTPTEVLVTEQPVDDTSQEETDQLTVKASSPLPTATTYSQPKTSPKFSLEVVDQFAGDILSAATAGDVVYMGLGTRVVMVDVSDPDRSKIINRSEILSGTVKDITLKQQLAYVATGKGGLDVLDVSEPASLKKITNVPVKGELNNLVTTTNLLFGLGIQPGEHRDGPGFISIIDVTAPTHPVELAWHPLPYPAHRLAVDKDILYVVGETGLHVFDASSPPKLREISPPAPSKRKYRDVSVGNQYVYLAGEQLDVMPHPLSDKATIVASEKVNAPDLNVVLAHDGYVYATSVFGGFQSCLGRLWVFDITQEEAPELKTAEALPIGCVYSLAIDKDRLYIIEENALRIVDVTDPKHPQISGVFNLPGTITNLELFGDYLYGSGGLNNGLHIFDISQPVLPRLANTLDEVDDWILQMEMLDERLYLSVFAGRIKTLDLSHPLNPDITDEFVWNESKTATLGAEHTYRILPSGMLVFATEEDNIWPTLLKMKDLTIDSKYLYLTGNEYNHRDHITEHVRGVLYIVDAENRSELQEIKVIDLPMVANAATVLIENYIYVPTVAEGIMIFDARPPVNLKLVGNLALDGSPTSVTREGQWLYITTDNSKLWVVDLSSPAAPQLVEYLNLPLTAHDMVVTRDYLYLAGGPGGILVVEKGSLKRVG